MGVLPKDNILYLDFETTGLNNHFDDVIEMAARKVIGGLKQDFHTFVKTKRKIQQGAFEAHGIDNAFLEEYGIEQNDAWKQLYDFIGQTRYFIAHNGIKFDFEFLQNNLNKRRLYPKHVIKYIDTAMICKGQKILFDEWFSIKEAQDIKKLSHKEYCKKLGDIRAKGVKYKLSLACAERSISVDLDKLHGAMNDMDLLSSLYEHISDLENYEYIEGNPDRSDYSFYRIVY